MKVAWHVAKYCDPYFEFVLYINPSKVHTHSSEHTPRAVDSIYPAAPGVQLGVRCLAQGHLNRGIGGGENLQFLPDRDSSLQPFEYKSYSPTIRPQLTPIIWWMNDELCIYIVLFVYCCTPKTLYNHVGGWIHFSCFACHLRWIFFNALWHSNLNLEIPIQFINLVANRM